MEMFYWFNLVTAIWPEEMWSPRFRKFINLKFADIEEEYYQAWIDQYGPEDQGL